MEKSTKWDADEAAYNKRIALLNQGLKKSIMENKPTITAVLAWATESLKALEENFYTK